MSDLNEVKTAIKFVVEGLTNAVSEIKRLEAEVKKTRDKEISEAAAARSASLQAQRAADAEKLQAKKADDAKALDQQKTSNKQKLIDIKKEAQEALQVQKTADKMMLQQQRQAFQQQQAAARAAAAATRQATREHAAYWGGLGSRMASVSSGIVNGILNIRNAVVVYLGKQALDVIWKFGSEFDQRMREVGTILYDTKSQLGTYRKELIQLSRELPFTLNDITEAAYESVSSMAVREEDTIAFLRVAGKAAVAGLAPLEQSVLTFTDIMNTFGLKVSDTEHIADVIFETIRVGKLRFEDLSSDLGMVSNQAKLAGLSFEEMMAAIATMTTRGLDPGKSETSLARFLESFTAPGEQASELAKSLGIEMSQTALKTKGFVAVLTDMREKVKNNIEVLSKLQPNIRGLRGAAVLTSTGFEKFIHDLDAMHNSAGRADMAFNDMIVSLKNQAQLVKNEIVAVIVESFDAASDQIGQFFSDVKLWVRETGPEIIQFMKSFAVSLQEIGSEIRAVYPLVKTLVQALLLFWVVGRAIKVAGIAIKFLAPVLAEMATGSMAAVATFGIIEESLRFIGNRLIGIIAYWKDYADAIKEVDRHQRAFNDSAAETNRIIAEAKARETAIASGEAIRIASTSGEGTGQYTTLNDAWRKRPQGPGVTREDQAKHDEDYLRSVSDNIQGMRSNLSAYDAEFNDIARRTYEMYGEGYEIFMAAEGGKVAAISNKLQSDIAGGEAFIAKYREMMAGEVVGLWDKKKGGGAGRAPKDFTDDLERIKKALAGVTEEARNTGKSFEDIEVGVFDAKMAEVTNLIDKFMENPEVPTDLKDALTAVRAEAEKVLPMARRLARESGINKDVAETMKGVSDELERFKKASDALDETPLSEKMFGEAGQMQFGKIALVSALKALNEESAKTPETIAAINELTRALEKYDSVVSGTMGEGNKQLALEIIGKMPLPGEVSDWAQAAAGGIAGLIKKAMQELIEALYAFAKEKVMEFWALVGLATELTPEQKLDAKLALRDQNEQATEEYRQQHNEYVQQLRDWNLHRQEGPKPVPPTKQKRAAALPEETAFDAKLKELEDKFVGWYGRAASSVRSMGAKLPGILSRIRNGIIKEAPKFLKALAQELPNIMREAVPTLVVALEALLQSIITMAPAILAGIARVVIVFALRHLPTVIRALPQAIRLFIEVLIDAIPEIIAAMVLQVPEIIVALIESIPLLVEALIDLFTSEKFYRRLANAFERAASKGLKQAFIRILDWLNDVLNVGKGESTAETGVGAGAGALVGGVIMGPVGVIGGAVVGGGYEERKRNQGGDGDDETQAEDEFEAATGLNVHTGGGLGLPKLHSGGMSRNPEMPGGRAQVNAFLKRLLAPLASDEYRAILQNGEITWPADLTKSVLDGSFGRQFSQVLNARAAVSIPAGVGSNTVHHWHIAGGLYAKNIRDVLDNEMTALGHQAGRKGNNTTTGVGR